MTVSNEPAPANSGRPSFLITIDTEGDNLWSRPKSVSTRNSQFLPRFQSLCEKYAFKPVYLTNYEMAECPAFVEFGRDALQRKAAEIGMHLHAWDSPPLIPLTSDDGKFHPYLIEYPTNVMRDKIAFMTRLLEHGFSVPIVSHRAGRWGFDERYARILIEHGYRVDCSVTPHVSWSVYPGDPNGTGGPDYRSFPEGAYFIEPTEIGKAGDSALLEVPVTIMSFGGVWIRQLRNAFRKGPMPWRILNRLYPAEAWLRPRGRNLRRMLRVLRQATREGRPYVEFTLHSSEFMPGGSPNFVSERDIEYLYEDLESLFSQAARTHKGATLTEFYSEFRNVRSSTSSDLKRCPASPSLHSL